MAALSKFDARPGALVEPSVVALLSKVRGESHTQVRDLLVRQGTLERTRAATRSLDPVRRARAAHLLGPGRPSGGPSRPGADAARPRRRRTPSQRSRPGSPRRSALDHSLAADPLLPAAPYLPRSSPRPWPSWGSGPTPRCSAPSVTSPARARGRDRDLRSGRCRAGLTGPAGGAAPRRPDRGARAGRPRARPARSPGRRRRPGGRWWAEAAGRPPHGGGSGTGGHRFTRRLCRGCAGCWALPSTGWRPTPQRRWPGSAATASRRCATWRPRADGRRVEAGPASPWLT